MTPQARRAAVEAIARRGRIVPDANRPEIIAKAVKQYLAGEEPDDETREYWLLAKQIEESV